MRRWYQRIARPMHRAAKEGVIPLSPVVRHHAASPRHRWHRGFDGRYRRNSERPASQAIETRHEPPRAAHASRYRTTGGVILRGFWPGRGIDVSRHCVSPHCLRPSIRPIPYAVRDESPRRRGCRNRPAAKNGRQGPSKPRCCGRATRRQTRRDSSAAPQLSPPFANQADRDLRPLPRRRLISARPARVRIRTRNPCFM